MTQYARPDETLFTWGDWTASTGGQLWVAVDEVTPNDTDYISIDLPFAPPYAGYGGVGFGLSSLSTPAEDGHVLKWRVRRGTNPANLNAVYLIPDDTESYADLNTKALAYKSLEDTLTTSYAESSWTLSAAEISAISQHYENLGVAFNVAEGGGATPTVYISWFEFQCPDAADTSRTTINTGPWVREKEPWSDVTWEEPGSAITSDNDPWTPWSDETWEVPSEATTDDDVDPWTPYRPSEWTSGPNVPYEPDWPSSDTSSGGGTGGVITWGAQGRGAFSPWFRASDVTDDDWGVDFVLKVNDQFPDYVSDVQPLTVWDSPITGGI